MKNRIDAKALELYAKYGIKPITMDDVAQACGMSKKTLYEHYANKKELVEKVIQKFTEDLSRQYDFIVNHANDAISEVLLLMKGFQNVCTSVNRIMIEDLEKYYFESWKIFTDFQEEHGFQLIRNNIQRGIREGLYHDRFDPDIIARMRLEQLIHIHKEARHNCNLQETLYHISRHYIAGLTTDKGQQLLLTYINQQSLTAQK